MHKIPKIIKMTSQLLETSALDLIHLNYPESDEETVDQEILHDETIRGMSLLTQEPLNPNAKVCKPKEFPRNWHHIRGKKRLRLKRHRYRFRMPESSTDDLLKQSIDDFTVSLDFKNNLEEMAKTIAFNTTIEPNWKLMKTNMLKAIFAILINSLYPTHDVISECPLSKISRGNFIHYLRQIWKPAKMEKDIEMCVICHEDMIEETPTIELLCKHKLCTRCFLKTCQHQGNCLMENCPICRRSVVS